MLLNATGYIILECLKSVLSQDSDSIRSCLEDIQICATPIADPKLISVDNPIWRLNRGSAQL